MTATITANNGGGTTTPHFITVPYAASTSSRNVIHDLIGGGVVVSLVAPRPRSGSFDMLYLDEASARAAVVLHRIETTFTLTETDRPTLNMTYVVDGTIDIALGDVEAWIVTVGYQEVVTP